MRDFLFRPRTEKMLIAIVCLVIGYLFGRGIKFQYFSISQDINLIEVASLAVTAWAAYHVGNVLARRNENIRVEKDLILVQIAEIEALLKEKTPQILSGSAVLTEVTYVFKKLGTTLNQVGKNLDLAGMRLPVEIKTLHESRKKLHDLCTGSPPTVPSGITPPIETREGILNFSQERLLEIERGFEEFYGNIFDLKVKTNRC